ncbi:MAG: hypothetical protein JW846_02865 [Dehalococcoidia bacterium]|nr:hypothetical protein [Dehalococcoidia bacterium]
MQYVHLPEGLDEHSGHGLEAHWAECRTAYRGREILYLLTDAVVDTVCCGDRTFHYATVVGYVNEWQTRKDEHGLSISMIDPITDQSDQNEVEALLKQGDDELQVSFRSE